MVQVNFFNFETGQLLGHGLLAGQKAELGGIGAIAQAQIDAARLNIILRDGRAPRLDPARPHRLGQ